MPVIKVERGIFPYSPVDVVADGPPPARFSVPIPPFNGGLWSWDETTPPAGHIRAGLCTGQGELRRQFGAAIESGEADDEELKGQFGYLFWDCTVQSFCEWLPEMAATSPVQAEFAWSHAFNCPVTIVDAWFSTGDVPHDAVSTYYNLVSPKDDVARPWVDSALRQAHAAGDVNSVTKSGGFVGRTNKSEVAALLLELHSASADQGMADSLARSMRSQSDPNATKVFREFCDARGEVWDGCDGDVPDPLDPFTALVSGLEAADPERCLRDLTFSENGDVMVEMRAAQCLARWVDVDRAAAAQWATTAPMPVIPGTGYGPMVDTLVRWPVEGDLEKALIGLQMLPGHGPPRWLNNRDVTPVTPVEVLEAGGAAMSFDVETGEVPTGHDRLLRELVGLVESPLSSAVFEETMPAEMNHPYVLDAWVGGKHYQVRALDLGDWYDLDLMVGWLNAMARDQGISSRFAVVSYADQWVTVVGGPEEALLQAHQDEIVVFQTFYR